MSNNYSKKSVYVFEIFILRFFMEKNQKRLNFLPWIHRFVLVLVSIFVIAWAIYKYIFLRSNFDFTDILFIVLLIFCFLDSTITASKSALTDGQTGLANDDAFIIYTLRLSMKKQLYKYTAVVINLKNYKLVNRIAGSVGGDKGLEIYGKVLKKYLSRSEKIARLGGDTFIALIRKDHLDDFLTFISEVKIKVDVNGIIYPFKISARCGLYALNSNDNIGSVFDNPTIALNYAKGTAKDIAWYDEKLAEIMFHEKEISSSFNDAIKNKEFKVYYQPKVDVLTNTIKGCEALVRWEKNGKIVSPVEFIPALENSGLITKLDDYVLQQVCLDIVRWKTEGLHCVRVSTNFSKYNLQDINFAQKVLDTINKYSIDKSLIEIELTESSNCGDYDSLGSFLKIMKENNISTAIDDFGVGYSSLELLKNLNVDVVKIDKRFIDDIDLNNGENSNIILVKHILTTCSELDKEVVCEGVETLSQRAILKEMKCGIIQGYLYDKPLECKAFEEKLKNPVYKF